MDLVAYRSLVTALEAEAERDPGAMRRRVFGLVALGYGYVVLILVGIVAAFLAVVVIAIATKSLVGTWKLLVVIGALLGMIVKSLSVTVDPPKGLRVSPKEAPRLLERVEEIRAVLRAPRPDEVLLTEDFNASVTQVPQLGLFDLPRTYLVLGLPLLYALTPMQFDAVLAHEFGHLSGSHPKRGLWVYRIARTWDQLMSQMEAAKSWGSLLFDRFFRWYVPRLNAYGFVMSRRDEYSADADAARVTSPEAIGSALVALEVRGRLFGEVVWPSIWAKADEQPEPPEAWRAVPQLLRLGDTHPARREWLGVALHARARENDTHPSLHDRLRALALVPDDAKEAVRPADGLVTPLESSAAEHYLPELAATRLDALETEWRQAAQGKWRERFTAVQAMRTRRAELDAREREETPLSVDELWEIAILTAELAGDEAAIPAAERCLAAHEAHAQAHFLLGRALLARGDVDGVSHIDRAMELDLDAIHAGTSLLYRYYDSTGNEEGKAAAVRRNEVHAQRMQEAKAERDVITMDDTFAEAALSADDRRSVEQAIRRIADIRSIVVARKVMRHFPEQPLLVFVLRRPLLTTLLRTARPGLAQEFIDAAALKLDFLLVLETRKNTWIRERMVRAGVALEITRAGLARTHA